jgi:hypothetical protein
MNFIEVNLFYKRLGFIVYQIDNKLKNSVNSNFNIEKSSVKNGAFFMIKYFSGLHRWFCT